MYNVTDSWSGSPCVYMYKPDGVPNRFCVFLADES